MISIEDSSEKMRSRVRSVRGKEQRMYTALIGSQVIFTTTTGDVDARTEGVIVSVYMREGLPHYTVAVPDETPWCRLWDVSDDMFSVDGRTIPQNDVHMSCTEEFNGNAPQTCEPPK